MDDVRAVTERVLDTALPYDPVAAELHTLRIATLRVACELRDLRDVLASALPGSARRYTVTVMGQLFSDGAHAPNVKKPVEVIAYSRDEAMAQVRMSFCLPTGEWWMTPTVVQCEPSHPVVPAPPHSTPEGTSS